MSSTESRLLIKPNFSQREYITVTPDSAGWDHLSFSAVKLAKGEQWEFDTGENELALTILGGTIDIESNQGEWKGIGSRTDVFHGMPTTLYLSRHTRFDVTAAYGEANFACGWA
ncbi:MAG TPA: 5-deoxy-glucuronate isomerase, partial [Anaerolineaceae bacterium]|nr:5-deoxy-glucuronate isomerase [Anaerolineaceae bacterium]